jgi:hypothetical protein
MMKIYEGTNFRLLVLCFKVVAIKASKFMGETYIYISYIRQNFLPSVFRIWAIYKIGYEWGIICVAHIIQGDASNETPRR